LRRDPGSGGVEPRGQPGAFVGQSPTDLRVLWVRGRASDAKANPINCDVGNLCHGNSSHQRRSDLATPRECVTARSCRAEICCAVTGPYITILRDTKGYRPHENTAQKASAAQGLERLNGTVPPRLTLNRDRRPREYLTPKEVGRLMEHARKRGRYGLRDATMILVAYRHGLRPGELCGLRLPYLARYFGVATSFLASFGTRDRQTGGQKLALAMRAALVEKISSIVQSSVSRAPTTAWATHERRLLPSRSVIERAADAFCLPWVLQQFRKQSNGHVASHGPSCALGKVGRRHGSRRLAAEPWPRTV
jgi:hypothetical protein